MQAWQLKGRCDNPASTAEKAAMNVTALVQKSRTDVPRRSAISIDHCGAIGHHCPAFSHEMQAWQLMGRCRQNSKHSRKAALNVTALVLVSVRMRQTKVQTPLTVRPSRMKCSIADSVSGGGGEADSIRGGRRGADAAPQAASGRARRGVGGRQGAVQRRGAVPLERPARVRAPLLCK